MTLSTVTVANTWLKSRHIGVPKDWLEACVDWITEENQVIFCVSLTVCPSPEQQGYAIESSPCCVIPCSVMF